MGFAAGFSAGSQAITGSINAAVSMKNALEDEKKRKLEQDKFNNKKQRQAELDFSNKLEYTRKKIDSIDLRLSDDKASTTTKNKLLEMKDSAINEFNTYARGKFSEEEDTVSINMTKALEGFNAAYLLSDDDSKYSDIAINGNVYQTDARTASDFKKNPNLYSVDGSNNLMYTRTVDENGNAIDRKDMKAELVGNATLMRQKKVLSEKEQNMKDYAEYKKKGGADSYKKWSAEESYVAPPTKPVKKEYNEFYNPEEKQWISVEKGINPPKGYLSKDQAKESFKESNTHLDKAFQDIAADRHVRTKEEVKQDMAAGAEELGLTTVFTDIDFTDEQAYEIKRIEAEIAKDNELYKRYSKMTEGQKLELIAKRAYKVIEESGDNTFTQYMRNLWPWAEEVTLREMTPDEIKEENKRRLLNSRKK